MIHLTEDKFGQSIMRKKLKLFEDVKTGLEMKQNIAKTNVYITEYDDTLVKKLIRNVLVVSDSKIEICFQNGVVSAEIFDI